MKFLQHCGGVLIGAIWAMAVQGTALAKADPNKVLHVSVEAPDDGFDLTRTNNLYSLWLAEGVFETLVTYDYLARPAKLVTGTIETMPEVNDNGKTYVFHLQKGIYFTPDPAFNGTRRELVANDYAYMIKHHLDPASRSVQEGNFRGKIVGMDALVEKAKKTGKFDYDAPVEGLETPDRYTLRIRLVAPDHNLLFYLAAQSSGAQAREVVEKYGTDIGRHPIGTGPYILKEYVPRSKVIFDANPDYRGFIWDFKSSGDPWDEQLIRDMKGKHMPQVGRIEFNIIEEEQARWLAFDSGQLDFEQLSPPAAPNVLDRDKLKPQFVARGIKLYRFAEPGTRHTFFNFTDPVVGGYTKDKIALRRALAMAYNVEDEIRQVWFGQGVKATSTIPPGVAGFDPNYRSSTAYDPELAGKLLDYFGYKKGRDGWRTMPDGSPLVVRINSAPKSRDILKMEIWKRSLDRINVHADFPVASFADNLKAAYQCKLSMWGLGGLAGIPDGSDFLESYYGPRKYQGNFGCYQSDAYDKLYEKAMLMPDGPERHKIYQTMEQILDADTVEVTEIWQIRNWMVHPWVKGFKHHPILQAVWKYVDVEKH